jgi:hypothetical protein
VPLSPGLTIVHGPNEAGKTTIQRAIELALTRKVTSNGADVDGLRPWDGRRRRPSDDRRRLRDRGRRAGDPRRDSREGLPGIAGQRPPRGRRGDDHRPDPCRPGARRAHRDPERGLLPVDRIDPPPELADLDRDEATLRDRLQASISGADQGTSRARRILERALFELNTKGAKNPGRLKVAEEAVAQAQAAVDQGEAALAQLERDRDTLSGARERRARSTGASPSVGRSSRRPARPSD